MSKSSLPTPQCDADLDALLGGKVGEINPDLADTAIAVLTARTRGEIVTAASEAGVGVRELARRLGVSAAAVSRHLRSEGDMRLSTAALFASALGLEWRIKLVRSGVSHNEKIDAEQRLSFEFSEGEASPPSSLTRRSSAREKKERIVRECQLAA
jgi:DNA-binding transcriptional ArsR family regulator